MSTFELLAEQLSSTDSGIEIRIEAAIQLSDNIEHYVSVPTYAAFLEKLVPIFINILQGPAIFIHASPEQRLRNCILEIFYQLPKNTSGPFELYAEDVVVLLMGLVRMENENNSLLCVNTIIDIILHHPTTIEFQVQSIEHVFDMFDQIYLVVRDQLDCQAPHDFPPRPSLAEIFHQQIHDNSFRFGSSTSSSSDVELQPPILPLPKASFRVLAQCLLIIRSIYKVCQASNPLDIKPILHHIKTILILQAKPQQQAHAAAATKGAIFAGISPDICNSAAFEEFVGFQVKALGLLVFMLPTCEEQLIKLTEFNNFLSTLPAIIVRLLKDCPREKSATRKELLIITRQIINVHFRRCFLMQIDELLEERILLGDGMTVYQFQRPLAYSVLADLIHHIRDALKPPQIWKTILVYTKNLQSDFPGTSFQTMSARLLICMAECIAKMHSQVDARHYLFMILKAIGDKFTALNRQYPHAIELSKLYAQQLDADKDYLSDWDEIDISTATPIKISSPQSLGAKPVADNKHLFTHLIRGLKDIFRQVKRCQVRSSIPFTAEEVQVLVTVFREGAYGFRYYETDRPKIENALELVATRYGTSAGEEKDLLEDFVAVLELDPVISYEAFYDQIPTSLDHAAQLSEIVPKIVETHKQMIGIERLINTCVGKLFDELNHSNVEEVHNRIRIYHFNTIDSRPHIEKLALLNQLQERNVQLTRSRPQAALNGVIWPVKQLGYAVASFFCIKPTARVIIDVKTEILKTQIRLSQKHAALPGSYREPFLEIAIDGVQRIEKMVHITRNSTFRALLHLQLNLDLQQYWTLLLKKIEIPEYGCFLASALEHLDSGALRKVVDVEKLILLSGDMGVVDHARFATVINSIFIIHSLCKSKERDWMGDKAIIIWLQKVGSNLRAHLRSNTLLPHLHLAAEQAIEKLIIVATMVLEYHPTDLVALFSLIESVANETLPLTQSVVEFFNRQIIRSESIEYRESIVLQSLDVCASQNESQTIKTFLLHHIVSPIIAMDVERSYILNEAVLESIHTNIWKGSQGHTKPGVDHSRMEALQLTVMLIQHHHSKLHGRSQDIIRFGLNYSEDDICKHAAYVVLGYCIVHFKTSIEITQHVYISLLESVDVEYEILVMQALELIASVLPNLCNTIQNDRHPFWVTIPRKILEGKDLQQKKATVFHFLVKHAGLFYEYREVFVVHIVEWLRRMAQPPNKSHNSEKLLLRLFTLVLRWEQRRVEGRQNFENSDIYEYEIPTSTRAQIIRYLAEFIVSLKKAHSALSVDARAATATHLPTLSVEMIKSMSLLHDFLHPQYWGDLDIDLATVIEIPLVGDPTNDKWVRGMISILRVVRIIADVKPHILKNTPLWEKLLEKCRALDNSEISSCLYEKADLINLTMRPLLESGNLF